MVFDPTTTSIEQAQWIAEFAQAPSAIVHDGFVRIYFSCRPAPDANGQYTSHCAFLDVDRNDLTRVIRVSDGPIMPLGDLGTFDQFGTYPMSVIRDHEAIAPTMPDGHAASRYRLTQPLELPKAMTAVSHFRNLAQAR